MYRLLQRGERLNTDACLGTTAPELLLLASEQITRMSSCGLLALKYRGTLGAIVLGNVPGGRRSTGDVFFERIRYSGHRL